MKNRLLLIMIMISSFAARSQSPFNNLLTINLPQGSQKINREQIPAETDKSDGVAVKFGRSGEFYKIGTTTFMELTAGKSESSQNSPEALKKGADETYRKDKASLPPKYSYELKTVNNYSVLLVTFTLQNNSYYKFYSKSTTAPVFLNGQIQFKEADRAKVKAMVDEMLNGLRFK